MITILLKPEYKPGCHCSYCRVSDRVLNGLRGLDEWQIVPGHTSVDRTRWDSLHRGLAFQIDCEGVRFVCLLFENSHPPESWRDWIQLNTDYILCPSRHIEWGLAEIGIDRWRLLYWPLGYDGLVFKPTGPIHDLWPDRFKFLFVGASQPESAGTDRKGLDLLTSCFVEQYGGRQDVGLVVKTDRVHWREGRYSRADNICYLLDPMTDPEMACLYRAIAKRGGYIQAHRGEGFGLTMLEAMACGCPVVATGWGGSTDFVVGGKIAYQVVESGFLRADYENGEHPCIAEPDRGEVKAWMEALLVGGVIPQAPSPRLEWKERIRDLSSLVSRHAVEDIELSCFIITQDRLPELKRAVGDIRPWVDELVVIDGGSTDGTREWCREVGIPCYLEPWDRTRGDIFKVQREKGLSYCRGQWAMYLDSDERLDEDAKQSLREQIRSGRCDAYWFARKNITDGVWNERSYPDRQIRLVKQGPNIFVKGPIHETLWGFEGLAQAPGNIIHEKTSERQQRNDAQYEHIYGLLGTKRQDYEAK